VRIRFLATILFLFLSSALCFSAEAPAPPRQVFREAGTAYEAGDFDTAIDKYRELVDRGFSGGIVYYNLGNAFYRKGQLGKALLNYRRAQRYMPRDDELQENITFARALVVDETKAEQTASLGKYFMDHLELFSRNELALMFSALIFLATLLACGAIYADPGRLKTFLRRFACISFTCALLLGGGTARMVYVEIKTPPAVILADRAEVRAGPAESYSTSFILHEGAEVTVQRERGEWLNIYFPAVGRGWVHQSEIEKI